jgi:glutathione S-transferase
VGSLYFPEDPAREIDMGELTLVIGNKNYSSWSLRPWIAMKALGIPFREELIPFDFEAGNPAIKDVSLSGKVPLLIDGDLKVWETLAILEYLAERFPGKHVWPEGVSARSLARSMSAEMATSFFALRGQCPFNLHRKPAAIAVDAPLAADIGRIDSLWRDCLDKSGGPFLFGVFSAADAMYAPVVGRFHNYALAPSAEAQAYMDAVRQLPAFVAWETDALQERWIVRQSEV